MGVLAKGAKGANGKITKANSLWLSELIQLKANGAEYTAGQSFCSDIHEALNSGMKFKFLSV